MPKKVQLAHYQKCETALKEALNKIELIEKDQDKNVLLIMEAANIVTTVDKSRHFYQMAAESMYDILVNGGDENAIADWGNWYPTARAKFLKELEEGPPPEVVHQVTEVTS